MPNPRADAGQTARTRLKKLILGLVPLKVVLVFYNAWVRLGARRYNVRVTSDSAHYHIRREDKEIRLSKQQALFVEEIVKHFDFFYSAVKPIRTASGELVDYSTPRWHCVIGFDAFPILFPSLAEPVLTTRQYIELASLAENAVVLDLGAYSGLTSILFDQAIPSGGRVIAVEADEQNITACQENFAAYERHCKRSIHLVHAAIWKDNSGVLFSSEGNMSSSAVEIVGSGRGTGLRVPSLTLLDLAVQQQLDRVDFIKCDIEGAEAVIFEAPEFFARFTPMIIIECHIVNGISTEHRCREVLSGYGYTCTLVEQRGYPLPLLVCTAYKSSGERPSQRS